jgi:LmbE family N-acetylglucosaminyl deacetylase
MKIAVLSPHRDDAAFSLGLTIGSWLQQGHAVEIVNVFTRSEYAPFSDVDSLHPNDRASFASAVRKREDEAWAKLYAGLPGKGRLSFTDLNLKDAPLRLHCSLNEVRQREPVLTEKVVLKIKRAMEQLRADALVLPLAVGNHVDHLTVRQTALPSDVQSMPIAFYEELPYATQDPSAIEAAVQSSALEAGMPLNPFFAQEPAETDPAITRKRKIAFCYDSQIDDATVDRIAQFCASYEGRERLWANASWQALAQRS